jgi:hypothetical protein
VELEIGKRSALTDGNERALSAAPLLIENEMIVPLAPVAEMLGLKVLHRPGRSLALASPPESPSVR